MNWPCWPETMFAVHKNIIIFWIDLTSQIQRLDLCSTLSSVQRAVFWIIYGKVDKHHGHFHESNLGIECSQPSIFLYFYLVVECMDRIVREMDTSVKWNTF